MQKREFQIYGGVGSGRWLEEAVDIVSLEQILCDGACFDDRERLAWVVRVRNDELRGLAKGVGLLELGGRARFDAFVQLQLVGEWRGGVGVGEAEFFAEPKNALRCRVLGG